MKADTDIPEDLTDLITDPESIRDAFEFIRAMKRLRVILPDGESVGFLRYSPGTKSFALDLRGTPATSGLPSIDGEAGKFLSNDGKLVAWAAVPGARLFTAIARIAAQSISNGAFTSISFDTAVLNSGGLWSAIDPTKLTIPAGQGGVYFLTGRLSYANNVTGTRYTQISKNGVGTTALDNKKTVDVGGLPTYSSTSFLDRAAAGDYYTVQAYQDSGGALNISSAAVQAIRLGD